MVESHLKRFGQGWRRHVEAPARRVHQMDGSPVIGVREKPRKTMDKTIKDLNINVCLPT